MMMNGFRGFKSVVVSVFALLVCGQCTTVRAQYTATSLSQLRSYASTYNNATITLAAGDYWIDGLHIANPTASQPTFLELTGTGNTYNLSGANIKLDTRRLDGFGRALGHDSGVEVVKISGSGNTINGLNLTGYDVDVATAPNAQRHADWAAVYVQMTGNNNTVNGANILTRGSSPYGYGDVFGKGARVDPQGWAPGPALDANGNPVGDGVGLPWIGHNKTSAFQVIGSENAVINNMHLDVRTYGHGFFVQDAANNTTLTNSTVTGQLFSSNSVIASAKYQEYGMTSHGNALPTDMMISGAEDGVRMYTGSSGLTVDNVVVTNMRTGFSVALGAGNMNLNNVEAYGTENAFNFRSNTTITNAKGDIKHGPLLHTPYDNASNTSIDITLVGGVPEGVDWAVAYLAGNNLDVTINSSIAAGALPPDSLVRFGQVFSTNWRDSKHPTGPEDHGDKLFDYINSTFHNNTNQIMVLGNNVTGNNGSSNAGVVSNGKDNQYDGVTVVFNDTRLLAQHINGLGNDGTNGKFDSNGTIVFNGSTLEIQSGLNFQNEKLVITGNGVDGKGALYSTGSVDSSTRFGSSNSSDSSAIFLNGNASIGVGVAGNQLLVGSIQGTGNLTKLGAGKLVMGKSSGFDGDLILAEGDIVARSNVVRQGLTVANGTTFSAIGGNALNTTSLVQLNGTLDLNGRTDANNISGKIGILSGSATGKVISSNPTAGYGSVLEIAASSGSGAYAGTIAGNISLIKSGNSDQSLSGNLTYNGTTTVSGGGLYVNGTHTGAGTYTVNGGTLGGSGTIQTNVTVNNGGRLAAGSAGIGSIGLLTLGGNYAQTAGATMAMDLQNVSTHDRVNVGGTTSLAGTLALTSTNPSQYNIGDSMTLLNSAGNLSGKFTSTSGVSVGTVNGLNAGLAVQYSANQVTARVSIMGDADLSNSVGNADIGAVFGGYGTTSGAQWNNGNFDGDGDIDNADIGTVFGNYGATLSGSNISFLLDPNVADLVYNPLTGQVVLDGIEAAGGKITNFVLTSNGRFINTSGLTNPFAGVFFKADANEISASDPLTVGLARIDLGMVLASNLTAAEFSSLFTGATYVGALGTGVQNFDLVFAAVPEPSSAIILCGLGLPLMLRRRRS